MNLDISAHRVTKITAKASTATSEFGNVAWVVLSFEQLDPFNDARTQEVKTFIHNGDARLAQAYADAINSVVVVPSVTAEQYAEMTARERLGSPNPLAPSDTALTA